MAYTPANPRDATWVGEPAYSPPSSALVGTWSTGTERYVSPGGFSSSAVPAPSFRWTLPVTPTGWDSSAFGTTYVLKPGQYQPGQFVVDASWVGAVAYTPNTGGLSATWNEAPRLIPVGIRDDGVGTPTLLWTQFLSPTGWLSESFTNKNYVLHPWQYAPAEWVLSVSWVGKQPYTPATGAVDGLWTLPSEQTYLPLVGWQSSAFGDSTVYAAQQFVNPTGYVATLWGTTAVQLNTLRVSVGGIPPPPDTGTNSLRQVPAPTIDYRTKVIAPTGIAAGGIGSLALSHFLRYVDLASRGISPGPFGTASVTPGVRTVYPISFVGPFWGTHVVRRRLVIFPSGWEDSVVGVPEEVVINTRRVYPQSVAPPLNAVGDPTIWNYNTVVVPLGWDSQSVAFPITYNLRKYVGVGPFSDNLDPTTWPNYSPLVENSKRYLSTFGNVSSRVSVAATIVNKADPIRGTGFDSLQFGGTRVEHVNRTIFGIGWDSYFSTQYAVVWNSARIVAPTGIPSTLAMGMPDPVLNLNRTILHYSPEDSARYGTAFIAFGIRYIVQQPYLDPVNGIPEVRLDPYPITPVGIPPLQVGGHEVVEHFNIINPFSVNVHSVPWVGEPWIRNRNMTVGPYGYDQSVFGLTVIENFIKEVLPPGMRDDGYGTPLIDRRTKILNPPGFRALVFPATHRIRNDAPDPPSPQNIEPEGIPIGRFGTVLTSIRAVWPDTLGLVERFGVAFVRTNVIAPRTIFEDGLFGEPTIPFAQDIDLRNRGIPPELEFGVARFTPHSVFAPAPLYPVDWSLVGENSTRWPAMGEVRVEHFHRRIGPNSVVNNTYPRFGTHVFALVRKIVEPTGIRSLRFGQVMFLGVPQFINLDYEYFPQGIPSTNAFGTAKVARPVTPADLIRYITPPGYVATLWGANRIELFNRQVYPPGIPHRGNPEQFLTSPWGTPLVGYPRTYVGWSAGLQTLWGAVRVEFKNRRVYPEGWNNLSLEDGNYDDYRFPMKVTRTNPITHAATIGDTSVWGRTTVWQGVRGITGRGFDSYNGGDHFIKASSRIVCGGWESSTFGDIDRWEAGKIKAYGPDTSRLGTPRILNPVRPGSVNDGVVSSPGVSAGVRPSGISPVGFIGPSVSNPFGCQTLVVTPLPVLSTQNVPAPEVEHV